MEPGAFIQTGAYSIHHNLEEYIKELNKIQGNPYIISIKLYHE
jgi:hypothetical protein